jgi:NAD(P)H-hydrate epimerase
VRLAAHRDFERAMRLLHPPLRPYARGVVWAPTGPESADFDRYAIEELGVPQPVLMENAGREAAQILTRLFPSGPVVALVGAGNNGGDALVLLRCLAAWGRDVRAVLVSDRGEEESVLHSWPIPSVQDADLGDDTGAWQEILAPAAVVVDGILGTGVQGAPRDRQARAIRRVNEAGRPVLAIDIPSGVDGATGAVPGEAMRADVTVSFGAPKLGGLLHPARALTGRSISVEIGFPPMPAETASAEIVTPEWAQTRLPRRSADTHKNEVGRLVVVAGKQGMAGAAVLAARAAFRAGAGLVQVCSAPENREVLQAAVPDAIFVDATDAQAVDGALAPAAAVAVGPGLGTGTEAEELLFRALSGSSTPLVVDADGLNLLAAGRPMGLTEAASGRPVLVTPHPGEMGRLLGVTGEEIAADRVRVVREAAATFGCAVLLKGAPSLVALDGTPILVDTQGSSDLAVAGMGDVLSGVSGGLLAQGLDPRTAGAVGLYLSGRAAVLAGRGKGLMPADVVRWIPEAMDERGTGSDDLGLPFVNFDHDPAR